MPEATDVPRPRALRDDFERDAPFGEVVGRGVRRGADVESIIAIDHGAARIRPPRRAGWGRAALAYGPYAAGPGLASSMLITNGHNASENAEQWPSAAAFLTQLLRGTQVDPPLRRLLARLRHRPLSRDPLWRRAATVASYHAAHASGAGDADNLAVGWFDGEAPDTPTGAGHGFIVRSAGPNNGTLQAATRSSVPGALRPTLREPLWNVPVQYVVVLRPGGALLLAAALEGTTGMAEPGRLRPLYLDDHPTPDIVWAGAQQRVLGQVGWGIDTRVHGVRVARVDPWAAWYSTAQAADRLCGDGAIDGRDAELGGRWRASARWRLGEHGARLVVPTGPGAGAGGVAAASGARANVALCRPAEPSGLVAARLRIGPGQAASLVLRADDDGSALHAEVRRDGVALRRHDAEGGVETLAEASAAPLEQALVQVLDDGRTVQLVRQGELLLSIEEQSHASACGVGFAAWHDPPAEPNPADVSSPADAVAVEVREWQAHPRSVRCPDELLHRWPHSPLGGPVVLDSVLSGQGGDLDGFVAASGQRWRHVEGPDRFELTDGGAVAVPVERPARSLRSKLLLPNGSRTRYEIDWPEPALADVELEVVNPGTTRHQGHNGRAGLYFAQDDDNVLLVNLYLNDLYDGASISCFFRVDGYEEVYDAVWNNLGRRVTWGGTNRLRVVFDGDIWTARLDDELVLHRRLSDVYPALSRWQVNRVGIMTNWEFGEDTGSRFVRVTGRGRSERATGRGQD